ncbi:MAG: hypothetical protein N7Q72_05645 [Spiroplasma sp. Tabriz.8]|nr:hypothetical protein [Spiroplasma sp. Tabriz.8]
MTRIQLVYATFISFGYIYINFKFNIYIYIYIYIFQNAWSNIFRSLARLI